MAYYNPDDILADSQKVPFTFDLDVPNLTPLNNGSAVEHGTKVEVPLWMAELLAVSKPTPSMSNFGTMDTPTALGPRVLNALKADPKSVDLRAQAQWYYGVSQRILDLFGDEDMVEVMTDASILYRSARLVNADLKQTFKQRAMELVDKSQNTRNVQGGAEGSFMNTLDETERRRRHESLVNMALLTFDSVPRCS